MAEKEVTEEELDWRSKLKKADASEHEAIAEKHGFDLKTVVFETEQEEAIKRGRVDFEEVATYLTYPFSSKCYAGRTSKHASSVSVTEKAMFKCQLQNIINGHDRFVLV